MKKKTILLGVVLLLLLTGCSEEQKGGANVNDKPFLTIELGPRDSLQVNYGEGWSNKHKNFSELSDDGVYWDSYALEDYEKYFIIRYSWIHIEFKIENEETSSQKYKILKYEKIKKEGSDYSEGYHLYSKPGCSYSYHYYNYDN